MSVMVPTMEPRNVWLIAATGNRIAIAQAANLSVHTPLKNKIMLVHRRGEYEKYGTKQGGPGCYSIGARRNKYAVAMLSRLCVESFS